MWKPRSEVRASQPDWTRNRLFSCYWLFGNRVRNLADVLTGCSCILQGEVEVSTRAIHYIAAHKSSLAVTRSRYLPPEVAVWSPVGRPLIALQCSRPTPENSLPPIPVEAFPSRDPLDVDGLFQQEFFRSPGPVNH